MLQSLLDQNTLLLLACSFLLQSDQNLLAPHLSTVAHEFGMNDIQRDEKLGGELAMGLFLLGAPAALAIGAPPCWARCFYETALGPEAGKRLTPNAGMPLQDLIEAWSAPFKSDVCPNLEPEPKALSLFV